MYSNSFVKTDSQVCCTVGCKERKLWQNRQSVTVDGKEFSASGEKTILQLFNESNLEHPQICHVPEVDPIQTCDTCIVEVDGKLMRACSTQIENGMHIEDSHSVRKRRRLRRWIEY